MTSRMTEFKSFAKKVIKKETGKDLDVDEIVCVSNGPFIKVFVVHVICTTILCKIVTICEWKVVSLRF